MKSPELAKKTLGRVGEKLGEVAALLPPASLPDLKKHRYTPTRERKSHPPPQSSPQNTATSAIRGSG